MNCFFFFSSRRRHTRSKRDWSSDVCSSDLDLRRPHAGGEHHVLRGRPAAPRHDAARSRSEERRVGKECRSRWCPYQKKKDQIQPQKTQYTPFLPLSTSTKSSVCQKAMR